MASITFAELINDVEICLAGYTLRQDRTTHLTEAMTTTSTTMKLASTTNIGKGVYQIDDELIWVDSYDRVSQSAIIPPYGRGYNGTTVAAHDVGAKVTVAPIYPRNLIKQFINQAIDAVYPNLFALGTYSFTYNPVKNTYEIPEEAQTIQYVSYETIGPSKEWRPVRVWRQDSMAPHASFVSGNTVTIYDKIPAGRTVFVHYTKIPTKLTNPTDDFVDVTGLESPARDVIMYGAAYRLTAFIDPGRLTYTSAEADQTDTKIQYGSGASTSRFLYSLYQQRLKEEADRLRDIYPARTHFTR